MIENAVIKYKDKKDEFKQVQKNSEQHRIAELNELAEQRAKEWDITASKAIVVIKEAEQSWKMHKKQRNFLKPRQDGGIKHVLVPQPRTGILARNGNITDIKTQCRVENPKDVFNVLLRQNFQHLLKSCLSTFSTGEIREKIGEHTESQWVEDILQGVSNIHYDEHNKNMFGEVIQRFMKNLRKVQIEGNTIEDFSWTYGVEEYRDTFKKLARRQRVGHQIYICCTGKQPY